MTEFVNNSGLEFTDISSEEYRQYLFNADTVVKISYPMRLNVSKSGGHRIFDAQGESHYIPGGWKHLKWKARDGQPHFVK